MNEEGASRVAMEAVRLAVTAAGPISDNDRNWTMKVHEAIPACAALLAGNAAMVADRVINASVFKAEFVRWELEESTKRLLVFFKSETTDRKDAESDGTESIRTEPSYTPDGAVMQRKVKALTPGDYVVVYKHVEPIDGGRKKVRVLVHLDTIRSTQSQRQNSNVVRRPGRDDVLSSPSSQSAGGGDSPPASPPADVSSLNDNQALAEIERLFNGLKAPERVAYGRLCRSNGIQDPMCPPEDRIEDAFNYLKEVGS